MMTDTEPADIWIWEYGTLDGGTVYTVNEFPNLEELKKAVDDSFFSHTWEEVERRGIRGTSILVGQNGRYEDTGHWVYRKPQVHTVELTPLAALLAGAEVKCTTGCRNGLIDNMPAVRAWEAAHADELRAYDEERRRTHRALVVGAEKALRDTEPRPFLICACNGAGSVLTADGEALTLFLKRHLLGLGEAQ